MIVVLFEAVLAEHQQTAYLDAAAALRPLLERIEGFVSIERFESLSQPGRLLSLSYWHNEAAVVAWRNVEAHRCTQAQGRSTMFTDYRIRVACVFRDYGMHDRDQVPQDSLHAHARPR